MQMRLGSYGHRSGLEYTDLRVCRERSHILTGPLHRLTEVGFADDVVPAKDRGGSMA